jgi:hypothetical protein
MGNNILLQEKTIRKVLRKLSKQRVLYVSNGNMIIDRSIKQNEETKNALMTCWFRGWVEPVEHNVMQAEIPPDGKLPHPIVLAPETFYRLTEAGWNVVNKTQFWVISTFIISFTTLITTLLLSYCK